MTSTKQKS
uniref:Uncharacterized protein n=1 Tax=Anguilla anguilla TaxID=7936 RepID=A0A0E9TWS6_ANGAN